MLSPKSQSTFKVLDNALNNRGSYWITTFGCQMNKADSERMAGILQKMGYTAADNELNADLVLFELC